MVFAILQKTPQQLYYFIEYRHKANSVCIRAFKAVDSCGGMESDFISIGANSIQKEQDAFWQALKKYADTGSFIHFKR